jgi:hypothetical protein
MELFNYVKSNTWSKKCEETHGKKGLHVLKDNQLFYKHRQNNDSINWKCIHSKKTALCKCTITIDENERVVAEGVHNGHEPMSEKEVDVLRFKILVKERCQNEAATACKIFSEEQNMLVAKHNFTNADVAKFAPSYRKMASSLQKRRAKSRPKLPNEIREIKLVDPKYTMTSGGQSKYLILNSMNNKLLVFCSPDGLDCLAESSCWHGDGTFHVASKYFYQLYIIHAWFKGRMIPCAFALMHRRRTGDYKKILKALVKASSKVLAPKFITTDFESAAIKGFKAVFSGIQSKGCMFHFGQNLMKRLGVLGLKSKYAEDLKFNQWVNGIFALALCPLTEIPSEFEKCHVAMPDVPRIDEFMEYILHTYFEGEFPVDMWNHFDNQAKPRTNNSLEAYNLKLKKFIKVSHPNIYLAVGALQAEEVDAGTEYHRALNGEKPGPRRKLYVTKDGAYGAYKDLLLAGEITIDVYMRRIVAMLVINKKKTQKTSVEAQSISSSSSSSGDGDDSDDDDDGSSDESETSQAVFVPPIAQGCDCKTKCKTKRCYCVHNQNNKCTVACHPTSIICENK